MAYEAGLAGAVTCFTGMLRRDFLATFAVAMAATAAWGAQEGQEMYGQIGKLIAAPGKRDELIANILGGVGSMPGCLSYVVAKDASNADAIWISEVWDSKASHDASLSIPSVKAAITKSLPIIAGSGDRIITVPVGGQGLGEAKRADRALEADRSTRGRSMKKGEKRAVSTRKLPLAPFAGGGGQGLGEAKSS